MTLHRPVFMQAGVGDPEMDYSAQETRLLLDALVASEGVVGDGVTLSGSGGPLAVTQRGAGANMSVDVGPGSTVIQGDDVTYQGKYLCVSDAVENVVVPAAPASGTRVHRLVAQVKDKLHDGTWTTYEWTLELLADTGAGTPAEPDSAITLATISVAAGQVSVTNSHIAMARPRMRLYSAASAAWNAYTPVVTTDGSAVTLGTGGSAAGRYQYLDGKVCHFSAQVVFGSNATFPSATNALTLSLPRADANTGVPTLVTAHAFDGGTWLLNGLGFITGAGSGRVDRLRFVDGVVGGDVDNATKTAPWDITGASPGDWRSKTLWVSGSYEFI